MARFVKASNPSNPDLLGHNLEDLAGMAGGLAATAFINDTIVQPIARQLLPGLFSQTGALAKLADAGSTAVAAWALGVGAGQINRGVARDLEKGGLVLAVGKGLSAVLPIQISGSLPGVKMPFVMGAPAPAALPAAKNGNGTTTIPASNARLGVGSMGL